MRLGILGCGTIGRFVLDRVVDGHIQGAKVVVVCGRSDKSKGRDRVRQLGIKWVTSLAGLLKEKPQVVVEAASHEALEEYGQSILEAGIDLVPTSVGALVDQILLESLKSAAEKKGCRIHLPSGGIGGLDALQAMMQGRVEEVVMTSRKPPVAWKNIPFVEKMGVDLDKLTIKEVLYEGSAQGCVKKFPQNINIAAALSLAGIGFEKTNIRIVADPSVNKNTHEIVIKGEAGQVSVTMQNWPVPENPKTTYMACMSTLAALSNLGSHFRAST
jgi:aspartate dehydrogenase